MVAGQGRAGVYELCSSFFFFFFSPPSLIFVSTDSDTDLKFLPNITTVHPHLHHILYTSYSIEVGGTNQKKKISKSIL